MRITPKLNQDNISFSLFLTDRFYDAAVEQLINNELILVNFFREVRQNVFLKNSKVNMDELGTFIFEYLFDFDGIEVHISCPIGQSLSNVYINEQKSTFRDLNQLMEFVNAVL